MLFLPYCVGRAFNNFLEADMKKHYFLQSSKAVLTLYRSNFRRATLLFYSLFFLLLCQAQGQEYASSKTTENEFAPIGALWHYTQWGFGDTFTTYKTIECISEVNVGGKLCKRLLQVDRYYADTASMGSHYMYSEEGRVYFYADDAFHLLYDFSAIAGDTLVLDYYKTYTGDPLLMIIDSTGTIEISGESRKIQYVTSGDGMMIEFADKVIEGIGGTYFMFPNYDGSNNGPLRCYQDQETDVWLSPYYGGHWNHVDCDQIITGVDEHHSASVFTIHPNPVSESFVLTISPETNFKSAVLYNFQGIQKEKRLLQTGVNEYQFDVRHFPAGVYLMVLTDNKQQVKYQKVIITKN